MQAKLMTVLLVTGLTLSQTQHICVSALERSARAFATYFHALQQEPLNPVEQVVFSLVLAKAKVRQDMKPPTRG